MAIATKFFTTTATDIGSVVLYDDYGIGEPKRMYEKEICGRPAPCEPKPDNKPNPLLLLLEDA